MSPRASTTKADAASVKPHATSCAESAESVHERARQCNRRRSSTTRNTVPAGNVSRVRRPSSAGRTTPQSPKKWARPKGTEYMTCLTKSVCNVLEAELLQACIQATTSMICHRRRMLASGQMLLNAPGMAHMCIRNTLLHHRGTTTTPPTWTSIGACIIAPHQNSAIMGPSLEEGVLLSSSPGT